MSQQKSESLIIVESPTKAKTITRYLGKNFKVIASMGHIKDLPKTKMGVDIENGFKPEYQIIDGKKSIIKKIKKEAQQSNLIYLAPDPDREGEAIAWHIAEEINHNNKKIYRVLFNEITKKGIEEGLKNPQSLDEYKYESQKTRRILDRLVGYELSPLLWKKVKRGLSAGRVQSVALRIIVEREKAIEEFVPQEYWKIYCELKPENGDTIIKTLLTSLNDKKITIKDAETADKISVDLRNSTFTVKNVIHNTKTKAPPPPFITSRLQQEATRKLKISASRVMQIAQQLYEGVELGSEGAVGLITYMRTDSTRISDDAVMECRDKIKEKFGADFLPPSKNVYPQKKTAQGAHEAIRPTSMELEPEKIKKFLTQLQYELYVMIWNRFLACQMKPAVIKETKIVIEAVPLNNEGARYQLEAKSTKIEFDGWFAIEPESKYLFSQSARQQDQQNQKEDEEDDEKANRDQLQEKEEDILIHTDIPEVSHGDSMVIAGKGVTALQKFTTPPPRFTEGTLIKELEERGIGRPSTYATIISTIQNRNYVRKYRQRFYPTVLGKIVVNRLIDHFPEIMDIEFTARMEEKLDQIEQKNAQPKEILENFYSSFHKSIENALKAMKNGITPEEYSKYKSSSSSSPNISALIEVDTICPQCGKKMVIKNGRFGFFLSCRNYPGCRSSMPLYTGSKCPSADCGGNLIEIKSSRTGKKRTFYRCEKYKNDNDGCQFVAWHTPINKACKICNYPLMTLRKERDKARITCLREGCTYSEEIPL